MRAWLRPSIQRLPAWRGGRAHGAYGVRGSGLGASPARQTPPEVREVIETTCVDVDESGEYGICVDETVEGRRRAVFVPGALPGNILRVAITGKRKKLTQGVTLEVIREHRGSVEPLCMYFGACGGMQRHVVHGSPDASHSRSSLARPGCTLQQMSYEEQLRTKGFRLRNAFERIAGLPAQHAALIGLDVQGSADGAYRYRNRVEFSAADGGFGKHRRGSTDLVRIEECALQSSVADQCYKEILEYLGEQGQRVADGIEYVSIRSARSGELLVNVATRVRSDASISALAGRLQERCPSVRGVVNSVLVKGSPVGLRQVDEVHVVLGSGFLEERLGDLVCKVSANAFFQVNTPMTEMLYRHVVDEAAVTPSEVLYDLYCGSGTISLFLAKHGATPPRSILGVEMAEVSVEDARDNVRMNGMDVASEYVCGDVGNLTHIVARGGHAKPDVVVVDPARSGLSKRALESILELAPRTVVYVSCNVSTQARDVKRFLEGGTYSVTGLKGFDLYPQTTHVESVCTLART